MPTLEAFVTEAVRLLKEVEWQQECGPAGYSNDDLCPYCGQYKTAGHASTCELDLWLKRVESKLRGFDITFEAMLQEDCLAGEQLAMDKETAMLRRWRDGDERMVTAKRDYKAGEVVIWGGPPDADA